MKNLVLMLAVATAALLTSLLSAPASTPAAVKQATAETPADSAQVVPTVFNEDRGVATPLIAEICAGCKSAHVASTPHVVEWQAGRINISTRSYDAGSYLVCGATPRPLYVNISTICNIALRGGANVSTLEVSTVGVGERTEWLRVVFLAGGSVAYVLGLFLALCRGAVCLLRRLRALLAFSAASFLYGLSAFLAHPVSAIFFAAAAYGVARYYAARRRLRTWLSTTLT
ncbi:MAG: hypothetical protein QW598_01415 [Pyrobaculum sp.]